MLELKNEYIRIQNAGRATYGGSQSLSDDRTVRACGCGLVAAADLLLYLCKSRGCPSPLEKTDGYYRLSDYNGFLRALRRYFPIIPPFGINGALLAVGLQMSLRRYGFDHHACLCASGTRLWDRVGRMLEKDIPVILAIGPNFPLFWGENRLRLYARTVQGTYSPAASTKAHFVTVTGIDGDWCRISSWGRELYINIPEYKSYVRQYSNSLLSNIIILK